MGVLRPDDGIIAVEGVQHPIPSPVAATHLGFAAVYQEAAVFPQLSVAESIFAGRRPKQRGVFIDWGEMHRRADAILRELGTDLQPDALINDLGIADRQLVEIAKALSMEARLLILDEATSALTPHEADRLFSIVRGLCAKGVAVLFVTHRLEEVRSLAHVITILRDGLLVAHAPVGALTQEDMVRHMAGRTLEQLYPKRRLEPGRPVLEVKGLSGRAFRDVSFSVREREIVGMAGFVGAGRSEVARSLFGIDGHDGGEVRIEGKRFEPSSPRAALKRGLAYLPEDRLSQGLIAEMSVASNIAAAVLPAVSPGGIVRPRRERQLAESWVERLRIKVSSARQSANELSGGTQQKLVLAKWLATEPKVFILDEPTRGVDVTTKAEIHRIIGNLAADGIAILLISSDLNEVLAVSDRILVMNSGHLEAEFEHEKATPELVILAATGVNGNGNGSGS
jgi:rhamnose transport system ATP-binding protein